MMISNSNIDQIGFWISESNFKIPPEIFDSVYNFEVPSPILALEETKQSPEK